MNLYLVRHGKAEPASVFKKDRDRELTEDGIHILNASFGYWKNLINKPDFILSSPFVRAVQTAGIIAHNVDFKGVVMNENLLSPGSSTNSLIELSKSLEAEDVILVGHQPDLSFHVSRFIGGTEVNMKFSPGTIAKIHFDGKPRIGKGDLIFLLPPVTNEKKG